MSISGVSLDRCASPVYACQWNTVVGDDPDFLKRAAPEMGRWWEIQMTLKGLELK